MYIDQERSVKATATVGSDAGALRNLSLNAKLELYAKLSLARLAEEKIIAEYFLDGMKTPAHLGIGGEAIPIGVVHCLPDNTKYFGTYRNHTLFLALSDDLDGFFGEMYGKQSGISRGKAGSMHLCAPEHNLTLTSAIVASTIPVATGAAFASHYRGSGEQVAVFFGDGATEEGVFFESINFAALHKLPILYVCEDNGYAIHTPQHERQSYRDLGQILAGYPCHYLRGDGRRLESVIACCDELLQRMARDPAPALLHLDYYRFLQHCGTLEDYDAGYRQRPADLEQTQDPLRNFAEALCAQGVLRKELAEIDARLKRRVDAACAGAISAPFADPAELWTDVLADTQVVR